MLDKWINSLQWEKHFPEAIFTWHRFHSPIPPKHFEASHMIIFIPTNFRMAWDTLSQTIFPPATKRIMQKPSSINFPSPELWWSLGNKHSLTERIKIKLLASIFNAFSMHLSDCLARNLSGCYTEQAALSLNVILPAYKFQVKSVAVLRIQTMCFFIPWN